VTTVVILGIRNIGLGSLALGGQARLGISTDKQGIDSQKAATRCRPWHRRRADGQPAPPSPRALTCGKSAVRETLILRNMCRLLALCQVS
jgi:hypothetical protein